MLAVPRRNKKATNGHEKSTNERIKTPKSTPPTIAHNIFADMQKSYQKIRSPTGRSQWGSQMLDFKTLVRSARSDAMPSGDALSGEDAGVNPHRGLFRHLETRRLRGFLDADEHRDAVVRETPQRTL